MSTSPSSASLVDTAMQAVKGHIRDAGLRVGDNLPSEGHFSTELGVSKAVVREAFRALAALKLIDVANGRRARVGALDGSIIADSLDHALSTAQIRVADVWDVRRTIEMRTAVLAAQNATPRQAAIIVSLADQLAREDHEDHAPTETDIAFHVAIAEASGNELFHQIVASFVPLMRVSIPRAWKTRKASAQRADVLDRHCRLAQAIADHDPEEARLWMAAHFDATIGSELRSNGFDS